jgi:hypothetical protein
VRPLRSPPSVGPLTVTRIRASIDAMVSCLVAPLTPADGRYGGKLRGSVTVRLECTAPLSPSDSYGGPYPPSETHPGLYSVGTDGGGPALTGAGCPAA